MSTYMQVLLAVALACSLALNYLQNLNLEYERTKPIIIQARCIPSTGDLHARLQDRPDNVAVFKGLCGKRLSA